MKFSRLAAIRAQLSRAPRKTGAPRDARVRRNVLGAVSATVALALTGVPGTAALWTGSVTTSAPSLTAGSVSAALSGFGGINTTFSSGFLAKTETLVFSNQGTSAAQFTAPVTLSPTSSATLANAITVTVWSTATGSCHSLTAPVNPSTGTWASFPQLSGTVAGGSSVQYCMRTRMPATSLTTTASVTPTMTLNLTVPGTTWSSAASQSATQAVVGDPTVENEYTDAVRADGAQRYWRLGEPSIRLFYDWIGEDDAYAETGITQGTAGALVGDPNTATTFSGTSAGTSGTRTLIPAPNTFAVEAWFKTTSTAGGKIVGFGNKSSGDSNLYDRHIFMDNLGRITFGVVPGTQKTIRTTASLNDGQWHHVVGNLSSAGMQLFVDGVLIGMDTTATSGHAYSGYWRIGGDPSWGTGSYFAGTIDEVAVYGAPLSFNQVNNHRNLGRQVPAGAADPYGSTVYADSPSLYWRLGESSGVTVADTGGGGNAGTYSGSVSKPVRGAVLRTRNTAASFNGTDGLVMSNTVFTNPQVYSLEVWFNTTTTTGGKLIGFGDGGKGNGESYSHDRHIYLQNDGRIRYGIYPDGARTISSAGAYNDGQWHHVVATQSSAGMKLYVDGNLVNSNSTHTSPEVYNGYWQVGGGTIGTAWSGIPTTTYVTAKIDEVAVYGAALTDAQVKKHYSVATGAPAAAFTASVSGLTATLNAAASSDYDGSIAAYSWNFGDGTAAGSGVSTTHTYASAVPRTVTLTVTDNAGRTSTTSALVTPDDTTAPTTPGAPTVTGNTGTTVSLSWPASTDDVGVASYEIYRGATLAGTSSTRSFTDTGLAANTTYTYTVRAKDAAGNRSAASPSVSVTTLRTNFNSGVFYSVSNVYNGKCLRGGDAGSGDTLRQYTCATATNQNFQFVQLAPDNFVVNSRAVTTMAWDVAGSSQVAGDRVKMATQHGGTNQLWKPVFQPTHDAYSFVNRNSGMCLQVVPDSTTDGLDLQQAVCGSTTYQYFKLTAVP